MKILILLSIFYSSLSFGFVLIYPKYELRDATKTKIKLSSEGCTANGIPDSKIVEAIKISIDFWNDAPESRLNLKYGGRSSASLTDSRIPVNEIIVGCASLPSINILGSAEHDRDNGSARVKMNSDVYTGSYSDASFIGTMIHEIGHGIGLAHSKDAASVMTYSANGWGDRPKYISQDDVDGIVYLYPNEKEIGGLAGSCSSFANEGGKPKNFYLDAILGFVFMFLFAFVFKKIIKR